jgi:hypothetical protein
MSEQRLAELLGDLASDIPPVDGSQIEAAWQAAEHRRRRRGALVAVGAASAVIVGTAVALAIPAGDMDSPPGDGTPTAPNTSSTSTPEPPDTTYNGVPVWWAPPATQETKLPWLDAAPPRTIDLSPGQPTVEPGQSALGVFVVFQLPSAELDRFMVLTADGDTRELPADHIERNRDRDGNAAALTPSNGGVSPDGRHALIAQPSSIELYDFESGSWITIDTPNWVAEGARWLDNATIWVPDRLTGGLGTTYGVSGDLIDRDVPRLDPDIQADPADIPYGIWVVAPDAVAGSYFLHGPVHGGTYANPEAIVARVGAQRSVLALAVNGRGKGCCPVVGWVGDDTVAFQSGSRVLAWRVGTGQVYWVAELAGLEPRTEHASQSWAREELG